MSTALSSSSIADLIATAKAHVSGLEHTEPGHTEAVDLASIPEIGVVLPIEVQAAAPAPKQEGTKLTSVRIVFVGTGADGQPVRFDFASPEVTVRAAGQKGQRFAIKSPTEIETK